MVNIQAIPAFNDNYIWIISEKNYACVIDPGQKDPVLNFLQENKLRLSHILVTHHHQDHTGGVVELAEQTGAKVYGPMGSKIEGIDVYVQEGDSIDLHPIDACLNVLEVPGHTLDHVAYTGILPDGQSVLFCGDTLFSCGSGRLFEGNSRQMLQSLDKFKNLSDNTLVYCAHEYTLSNIRWALAVEPSNPVLQAWQQRAEQLRKQALPTVPTTLDQELQTNPFLRLDQPTVRQAAERYAEHPLLSPEEVLASLREWKNNF